MNVTISFSDDTAIVGLIQDDDETSNHVWVDQFFGWCRSSFLNFNAKKTKEIIFDFRNANNTHQQMTIKGSKVVDNYKDVGTIIYAKLSWNSNTDVIYKKDLQRQYFKRKLRQFRVDGDILVLFYRSFMESTLTFCFTAWYFSLSVDIKNQLHKIVHMSGKIT